MDDNSFGDLKPGMKIYFYEMRSGMERCKKEKKQTFLCGDCKKEKKFSGSWKIPPHLFA